MKPQRLEFFARLMVLVVVVVVAVTYKNLGKFGLGSLPGLASKVSISTPVGLQSAASGGSIAFRWLAVKTPLAASKYKVFRNGSQVATLTVSGAAPYTFGGTVFYDSSVTAGRTYTYQVAAVSSTGSTSALSGSLSVKAPSLMTPVPVVTLNNGGQADLNSYLQNGATMIKYWYPKIADRIVGTDHTVPSAITVAINPNADCGYAGVTTGATVTICAGFARSAPNDMSVFTHETTHVLQQYTASIPGGIVEGMASWAADWSTAVVQPLPPATSTYDDGYAPTSYFLSWVTQKYAKPNLVHDINVAAYRGSYSDDIFRQQTGQTIGQLWTQMSGHLVTSPGPVTGTASKCIDLAYGNTTDGSAMQLLSCYGGWAQQYIYTASSANPSAGLLRFHWVGGKCMVTAGNGTANGTRVVIGPCNDANAAAQWLPTADGALLNVASGRCLRPIGASQADGTPLEITDCRSTVTDPSQRWVLPAS